MLLKQIGRGNLAVGRIYEGHVNALQLVQSFGTREQIEQLAEDARLRHKIFGVWNAEAEDGVKIIPLSDGQYRLEGSKTFASGYGDTLNVLSSTERCPMALGKCVLYPWKK